MQKWNRVIFIDGPEHTVTRTMESEPPREWIVPGYQSLVPSSLTDSQILEIPKHKYIRTYQTRNGTWIYEYCGQV